MKFCYVVKEEDIKDVLGLAQAEGGLSSFSGNTSDAQNTMNIINDRGFYAERPIMEVRPDFKQVIPCFVIRDSAKGTILLYQRKLAHTESRLAGMWTPAFGGHVDPEDSLNPNGNNYHFLDKKASVPNVIANALSREMREETGIIADPESLYFEGFIYDSNNDVGRVHLGVLFSVYTTIDEALLSQIRLKPEINNVITVDESALVELLNSSDYILEGWAGIILSYLESLNEIRNG